MSARNETQVTLTPTDLGFANLTLGAGVWPGTMLPLPDVYALSLVATWTPGAANITIALRVLDPLAPAVAVTVYAVSVAAVTPGLVVNFGQLAASAPAAQRIVVPAWVQVAFTVGAGGVNAFSMYGFGQRMVKRGP